LSKAQFEVQKLNSIRETRSFQMSEIQFVSGLKFPSKKERLFAVLEKGDKIPPELFPHQGFFNDVPNPTSEDDWFIYPILIFYVFLLVRLAQYEEEEQSLQVKINSQNQF
jgi:hypothetical protein